MESGKERVNVQYLMLISWSNDLFGSFMDNDPYLSPTVYGTSWVCSGQCWHLPKSMRIKMKCTPLCQNIFLAFRLTKTFVLVGIHCN